MGDADLYLVLEVSPKATLEEIRAAYYRQVRKHPPEKDADGFRAVQAAFDVLGDPASRKEYDEQRSTDPETLQLVEKGRALLEDDDADAIAFFKRALVRQPNSLTIRDLLVQALLLDDDYDEAEKQARILVRRAPESAVYWCRLGDVLRTADRDGEAEQPFRKAVVLDAESPPPTLKLAYLLNYLDRADEAIQLLRRGIMRDGRVDFGDFLYFQALMRILISEDRIDELSKVKLEIRNILPPDPETKSYVAWCYYMDGMMLAERKNFDAALQMIDEAGNIDDSLPELKNTRQRVKTSKSALDEERRLREDDLVMPELRLTVAPLVVMRVLDLKGNVEKVFENALQGLHFAVQIEGSPVLAHISRIRLEYPAVAVMTADFLARAEELDRTTPKTYMTLRCPSCGTEAHTNAPSTAELVKAGLTREQARVVWAAEGRNGAKKYMVYQCKKCHAVYNGRSERVTPAARTGQSRSASSNASIWTRDIRISPTIGCLVLVLAGVALVSWLDHNERESTRPSPAAPAARPLRPVPVAPVATKPPQWHVTSDALNVRSGPGTGYDSIERLRRFDTVEVLERGDGGWWRIRSTGGKNGYASASYLREGAGDAARVQWCRENAGPRPLNGHILKQTRSGPHQIVVHNSPGRDAVVKLKPSPENTVLSFFLRAGETAVVSTVPEGSFTVYFAFGRDYSRACGYFLTDMAVQKDPESVPFYGYSRQLTYTLKPVQDGNLRTQSASMQEFLDQ